MTETTTQQACEPVRRDLSVRGNSLQLSERGHSDVCYDIMELSL